MANDASKEPEVFLHGFGTRFFTRFLHDDFLIKAVFHDGYLHGFYTFFLRR